MVSGLFEFQYIGRKGSDTSMFELEEKVLNDFLNQFQSTPFQVDLMGKEQIHVGMGIPEFVVHLKKDIKKADLLRSTSLALGEAYMEGD
ncbi:MAG: hypothetical protein RR361_07205, partial [Anaerovorax sp.]